MQAAAAPHTRTQYFMLQHAVEPRQYSTPTHTERSQLPSLCPFAFFPSRFSRPPVPLLPSDMSGEDDRYFVTLSSVLFPSMYLIYVHRTLSLAWERAYFSWRESKSRKTPGPNCSKQSISWVEPDRLPFLLMVLVMFISSQSCCQGLSGQMHTCATGLDFSLYEYQIYGAGNHSEVSHFPFY